jgi:hypothetical protein
MDTEMMSNPMGNELKFPMESSIDGNGVRSPTKRFTFDPAVEGRKNGGTFQLHLPKTINSSVILNALIAAPDNFSNHRVWITFFLPQGFVYCLVVAAQFTICFFLASLLKGSAPGVCQDSTETEVFLKCVCVATFCSFCWSDILESASMWHWVSFLPTWTDEHLKMVQERQTGCLLMESLTFIDDIGVCKNQVVTVTRPVTGITHMFRTMIFLFVIVPKVVLAILLMGVGCGFIIRAEGVAETVLNTVAVSFVMEVDDYAYKAFTTVTTKILHNSLPPIGLLESEISGSLLQWEMYGSIIMVHVLVVSVAVALYCWCYLEPM